jgi:hypothetical protein
MLTSSRKELTHGQNGTSLGSNDAGVYMGANVSATPTQKMSNTFVVESALAVPEILKELGINIRLLALVERLLANATLLS